MSFHRPAPHTYTVTITVGNIRATARHHSLSEALRHTVEMIGTNRTASEARTALAKKAASRLLKAWREMGRPDALRIHPGQDCPARAEMSRV